MSRECTLTIDELDQLEDISGAALYRAEVQRLPYLTPAERDSYLDAARAGSIDARNELICDCLHYTLYKADVTYRQRSPPHSDMMDLVGHAHVALLEAFPKALTAATPMKYLLSIAALEMRLYCTYDDPLVQRPRSQPFSADHPRTVRIEPSALPTVPIAKHTSEADYWRLHEAIQTLTEQRREIIHGGLWIIRTIYCQH